MITVRALPAGGDLSEVGRGVELINSHNPVRVVIDRAGGITLAVEDAVVKSLKPAELPQILQTYFMEGTKNA